MKEQSKSQKEYDIALDYYFKKIKSLNLNAENIYMNESEKHPMHPSVFYQLNEFTHFRYLSDKIYKDYLIEWSIRYHK